MNKTLLTKNQKEIFRKTTQILLFFALGCAADPASFTSSAKKSDTDITDQNKYAASLIGARVDFHYSNFYSLSAPNPSTSCAGDANVFYDPITMVLPSYPEDYTGYSSTTGPTGPYRLPTNVVDPSTTLRPSFIKNISVDMTDSNAPQTTNQAFSCSFGSGPTAPPVSSCATFDYGAIDGIPSSLGGSLLILGGIQSVNYAGIQSSFTNHGMAVSCGPVDAASNLSGSVGYNYCNSSMYALGINTLPPSAAGDALAPGLTTSTLPISTWANLSGVAGYTGPRGLAGASSSYNTFLQKIMIFGGASPLSGMGPTGYGSPTYDTWTYDIKQQKWIFINTTVVVDPGMQRMFDTSSGSTVQLSKSEGGRALFGYAAVPGMAISQLSSTGGVTGPSGSGVDTTDRIVVLGGLGQCTGGVCTDGHRFNPTFGPEYMDTLDVADGTLLPAQWIDSYHTQLISNSKLHSQYTPVFPPASPAPDSSTTTAKAAISFGMVGITNNFTSSTGIGPTGLITRTPGAGYLLVAGGFYGYSGSPGEYNNPSTASGCPTSASCGGLALQLKWFDFLTPSNYSTTEGTSANFGYVTNYNDYSGTLKTPAEWLPINEGTAPKQTPWYGGGVMLKGLNIPLGALTPPAPIPAPYPNPEPSPIEQNQVVYFGGAPCKNYITQATTSCLNWPTTYNDGKYWIFGIDPGYTFTNSSTAGTTTTQAKSTTYPTVVSWGSSTTPPKNAGMAAARGNDLSGNPLIVSWGGMDRIGLTDDTGNIYYLYHNTTTDLPTWGTYQVTSATKPKGLANAAMVYSHVTGKFYVFGGYNPSLGTVANTWELSLVSGTGSGCGKAASATCEFSWRLLDGTNGLTCYPNCPTLRRSHRMVEVNYNNINAPFDPVCTSSSLPCSFGIFMQGGTPDGTATYFADRWMFDPTANGGAGHWQKMDELPPRTLGGMATLSYSTPSNGRTAHRAVLFGGETGLQNPVLAGGQSTGYFIPPTLGDTWMYDFEKNSWNRVTLYGQRYSPAAVGSFSSLTERDARLSSSADDATTTLFSPPPLSGSIMVTRTGSKTSHLAADKANPLTIPEVFLFGGRKKDGTYQLFDQVYKFCAGSTGEKPYPISLKGTVVSGPDDASCDSYDATLNPLSISPVSEYTGRWLLKRPLGDGISPAQYGSYMGAGAYDSVHDLIVLYGGLAPSSSHSTAAVTDSSTRQASTSIMEYTPPSAVQPGPTSYQFNGYLTSVPICSESPETPQGRYGHSLAFDPLNESLIIAGGYGSDGSQLVQTITYSDGRTYQTPEVWTAFRVDSILPNGNSKRNIPAITQGPFPCYYWSRVTTFGNSIDTAGQTPPFTGISHAASVFIPPSGYNTGYYTMFDSACIKSGPISSTDPNENKLLVGGAYFDIDRTQLGANENLILNLTFIPFGTTNTSPDQTHFNSSEAAIFKVHLIKTGESGDQIRQRPQPRDLIYASTESYPQTAQDIAVIAPPTGQIREEQIFIPLSIDPAIDRIEVRRRSGSGILIKANLYRLGPH